MQVRAADHAAHLLERLTWLVRLRWSAIVIAGVVVVTAAHLGVVVTIVQLFAGVAMLALSNGVFQWLIGRTLTPGTRRLQNLIASQVLVDLLVLAWLLHFSGGADNPFTALFVVPIVVAAMLLPLRDAVVLAISAGLLLAAVLVGELTGLIAHNGLQIGTDQSLEELGGGGLWQSATFVGGYLAGFQVVLLAVAYLVHSLADRLAVVEAERRQHERIAVARERLARVGELSAGVVHSVRNPLHTMLACTDILKTRLTEEQATARRMVATLVEGIERIEGVTQRLLALTQPSPPQLQRLDLRATVDEAVRFVGVLATERGVTVRNNVPAPLHTNVDGDRMFEAIVNVLDNAIRACQSGGSVVVTGAGTEAGRIDLEITDTGVGIPAEELSRVFEPFYSSRYPDAGTGLGLAMARRSVEEHGGRMTLNSQIGAGTVVGIHLDGVGHWANA